MAKRTRTVKQSSTVGRKSPGPKLIRGMKQLRDSLKSGIPLPTRTYVRAAAATIRISHTRKVSLL